MTSALKAFADSTAVAQTYIEDVFDIRLYNGNAAARSLTTGLNMSANPGMVWIKRRNTTENHCIFDTIRGTNAVLVSHSTAASTTLTNSLTAFGSTGFSLSSATGVNTNGGLYAAWSFRQAAKFFQTTSVSHTSGVATTVNLSSLGTVGMVMVKRTDNTGDWWVWHKDLTAGSNLRLTANAAESSTAAYLSVSGTTLSIASAQTTGTYIVYAWAHDTSDANGVVRCGTYSGAGTQLGQHCGWEPQMVFIKRKNGAGDWLMFDNLRGMPVGYNDPILYPNGSAAEVSANSFIDPLSTGFAINTADAALNAVGGTYVWMAIRMPNKPPTTGSAVFNAVVYTGTNTDNRLLDIGIQPDMVWLRRRSGSGPGYEGFLAGWRHRGQAWVKTESSGPVETLTADGLDQQLATTEWGTAFSSNVGVYIGNASGASSTSPNINADTTANNHVAYGFRRRAKVFDSQFYGGNATAGRIVYHKLGVVPELIIIKALNSAQNWLVWHKDLTSISYQIYLDTSGGEQGPYGDLNNVNPTSTQFEVGSGTIVNGSGLAYMCMVFATLAGVSKVGTYTGNGGSQVVDCGFSSAARFLMIKGVSSGQWYVFDSARGILGGVDPTLATSNTAAENNTADTVATHSTGFVVGQNGVTNLSVNGAKYIYLAFS